MTDKNKPKTFAKAAVNSLTNQANYIKELEEKVRHLEEMLKSSDVPSIGKKKVKSKELEIIEHQISALHNKVVVTGTPMDRDDLKLYETLIKCYVQLKSVDKAPDKKDKDRSFDNKSDEALIKMMEKLGNV